MNYLGNSLNYLGEDRVNQWPDRMDRAVWRRPQRGNDKVCRPDRFVPEIAESSRRHE